MALSNPLESFVWGAGGSRKTPEQIARDREVAAALMQQGLDFSPIASPWQGAARVANAAAGAFKDWRADKAASTNATENQSLIANLLSGSGPQQFPAAPTASGASAASYTPNGNEVRDGIISTANALGIDPVDLGTAISYETAGTFDPTKAGPTTQWGQHKGLIQFGEPQAAKFGVDWNNPVASQLGPDGAVAKYLTDAGVKPGMGMLDIYSAINAGRVGRYNASDANNGGAPGTVRDKVEQQMAGHRQKALALLGDAGQAPAVAAVNAFAEGQPVQVASLDPSTGMASDLVQRGTPEASAQPLPNSPASLANVSPSIADPVAARTVPMQPGPMAGDPAHSAFIDRMTSPQSLTGGAPMPMAGMTASATQPPAAGAPSQVAQALASPDLSRIPVTAGGNAGVYQPGQGNMQAIVQALSSPYADDQTKKIAGLLLGQQMEAQQQANDPMRALDMEYKRAQLDALKNPVSTPTDDMREYEFAKSQGFPGSFVEFMLAQKKAGATTISDIGNTKGETEYDKAFGKNLAEKTIGILDAGQQAPAKIATYNQLLETLPGMYTGAGGDTILSAKRALKALGVDTGDLSGQEFVQAMGNQMALELRNPAGGAGMPGAMSDKDREFLASMSPGLTKTPEGNRKLLEYRIAVERRNQQVAQLANQYMNSHGGRIDNNFYSELAKWSDANPLFPEKAPEKSKTVIDGYTIEEVP